MATGINSRGMALQVHVGDMAQARAFYSGLFGRAPDFAPHEDFLEWQVCAGAEVWWQIVGTPGAVDALRTRVRLLVDDVAAAVERARTGLRVEPTPVTELPGVVAFTDFEDPWGNQLGFYEDLVPSGQQREPGGSVHDESMFIPRHGTR